VKANLRCAFPQPCAKLVMPSFTRLLYHSRATSLLRLSSEVALGDKPQPKEAPYRYAFRSRGYCKLLYPTPLFPKGGPRQESGILQPCLHPHKWWGPQAGARATSEERRSNSKYLVMPSFPRLLLLRQASPDCSTPKGCSAIATWGVMRVIRSGVMVKTRYAKAERS
jgi:hypothetical protein